MCLSNFMLELGLKIFSSVPINSDSTGGLNLRGTATYSSRTKPIVLPFFFLHELVETAKITIHHVGTGIMLADVATKHLGKAKHVDVVRQIKEFPL